MRLNSPYCWFSFSNCSLVEMGTTNSGVSVSCVAGMMNVCVLTPVVASTDFCVMATTPAGTVLICLSWQPASGVMVIVTSSPVFGFALLRVSVPPKLGSIFTFVESTLGVKTISSS